MEAKNHFFFKNDGDAFSLACDPAYLRWSTGGRCSGEVGRMARLYDGIWSIGSRRSGEVGRAARLDASIERSTPFMWQRREVHVDKRGT